MKRFDLKFIFIIGLVIRLLIIFFISPIAVNEWYLPFLSISTSSLTHDPWTLWLEGGGAMAAFPYGYAMWIAFIPMTLMSKIIGFPLQYGYELTILFADLILLYILSRFFTEKMRLILIVYWLSPIIIFANYGLGLNDIIPALLLTLSLLLIRNIELKKAGFFFAAAISAKLSMVIALPFFAIYLYNNKALRQHLISFIFGFGIGLIILGLPFLFSLSGLQMIIDNPEMTKILTIGFEMGINYFIYIVPLIYLIILYFVWRVRRLNFDLFQASTGMAFLLIVLMTPYSPGWFVWSMPFLVLYQIMSDRVAILMVSIFSLLFFLNTLFSEPIHMFNGEIFYLISEISEFTKLVNLADLLPTLMVAIGVLLVIRIWRESISSNDFFRLSRKPFVIGVAGDSGSGKDTFIDSISGLFGFHSVVMHSGDDYHLWDRQKPMWQMMTPLNPMANDLEGFTRDLISLVDGKQIQTRHYDHQNGKMGKLNQIKSNDFIIANGLHALYLPILRDCFNLKIYLDIDEGLRRHFKLNRDIGDRGHTVKQVLNDFNKRESDSIRFIHPQSDYADLVLSLNPIHPRLLKDLDYKQLPPLKLVVKTRHGLNELALNRVLVGVCGLHVDIVLSDDDEVKITIEGETSAADIEIAAKILCPHLLDFLDLKPKWQNGVLGLMQLITLSHISQVLTKQFIK
jgi:uridine kinase